MADDIVQRGGMRSLLSVSLPLMISYLSLFVMLFIDRAFLANLSTEALNAAVQAGTLAWTINLAWMTLAAMAEIFVAQNNGAKKFDRLGIPVWQMLWVGVFSLAVFIPLGIYGGDLIYGAGTLASEYFRWLIFVGPSYVFISALGAFFIGQGRTTLITVLSVAGNVVNTILDPILIFGMKGVCPPLGVKGAAIATGLGVVVQVVILFFMFLSRENRQDKGTANWKISWSDMRACLRVGISPALFVTFEMSGWACFYEMMTWVSPMHIFVTGVCQSIFMLFVFFGYGLEKGIAVVAGNFIGAGKQEEIYKLLRAGMKLLLIFSGVMALFFIVFPDLLASLFINRSDTAVDISVGYPLIKTGMVLLFFYVVLEKVRWLFNGVLTAAGDTFVPMVIGSISIWIGMIIPTYFFIVRSSGSVLYAFAIWIAYAFASAAIFITRFSRGNWKGFQIIEK